jgi:hypothetical protein
MEKDRDRAAEPAPFRVQSHGQNITENHGGEIDDACNPQNLTPVFSGRGEKPSSRDTSRQILTIAASMMI